LSTDPLVLTSTQTHSLSLPRPPYFYLKTQHVTGCPNH